MAELILTFAGLIIIIVFFIGNREKISGRRVVERTFRYLTLTAFSYAVFGVIKQDYGYIRLHRRGILKTELELTLVVIGFNLNKYHNKLHRSTMMPA